MAMPKLMTMPTMVMTGEDADVVEALLLLPPLLLHATPS